MGNDNAIEASNLTKIYQGSDVKALSGVALTAVKSEVFTLLGRNGANKTTFLRIATTQLMPTSGLVRVLDHDVVKEADDVRKSISFSRFNS